MPIKNESVSRQPEDSRQRPLKKAGLAQEFRQHPGSIDQALGFEAHSPNADAVNSGHELVLLSNSAGDHDTNVRNSSVAVIVGGSEVTAADVAVSMRPLHRNLKLALKSANDSGQANHILVGPVSPVYRRNTKKLAPDAVFNRAPLIEIDDIPVFSLTDAYVENYQTIAHDHVSTLLNAGENPFMADLLSESLEHSTRDILKRHGKAGQTILDIGVGPGRLLEPLTQFQRFGVDVSMDYLRIARDKGISVACSRIEDLPYEDELFDIIVSTDVIEHVLDLNYCTAQMLRVLKPGGKLVIRVPYNDLLEAYVDQPQTYEFVHLRKFDVPSLRLHFERIFECTFVESVPVFPYFKGEKTLKIRTLPQHSLVRDFASSIGEDHPAAFLKHFLPLNQEMLLYHISELATKDPGAYQLLAPHLLEPLEINVVFTK